MGSPGQYIIHKSKSNELVRRTPASPKSSIKRFLEARDEDRRSRQKIRLGDTNGDDGWVQNQKGRMDAVIMMNSRVGVTVTGA